MARIPKKTITDFSAGMQTSDRSSTFGGASLIKNFNIYEDGNALVPVPSWERWNKDSEVEYGIVTLGGTSLGNSDLVYGVGKATLNWWSIDWKRRIKLETAFSGALYGSVDLSILPDFFWDNVNDDGSDIRIVRETNNAQDNHHLNDFDKDAKTGWIMSPRAKDQNIFIYFDNPDATYSNDITLMDNNFGCDSFYTFDNSLHDSENNNALDDGASGTYTDGYFGQALTSGTYDTDSNTYISGNDEEAHFLLNWNGQTGTLFDTATLTFQIFSNGSLTFSFDTDPGSGSATSAAAAIPGNEWVYVSMYYNDSSGYGSVYVNGTRVAFTDDDSHDLESDPGEIRVSVSDTKIQHLFIDRYSGVDSHDAMYNMFFNNASYWNVAENESLESYNVEYGGTKIYQKNIGDEDWSEYLYQGTPVSTTTVDPVPSFVFSSNGLIQTLVTSGTITSYFYYLTEVGYYNGDDWTGTLLSGTTNTALPSLHYAADKINYFHTLNGLHAITGAETVVQNIFSPYSNITAMTPYSQYMGILVNRGSRAFAQLWDLDSVVASEFIDVGIGQGRTLVNVYGTLFAVVNRFIDESSFGNGTQSLDIRAWKGGGYMENFYSLETPYNVDGYYSETYRKPIANQVLYVQNAGLFYARTPDQDGNIQEGLWAIGKSETSNSFGVSIYKDTSDLGDVEYMYRSGGNIIVIHDGGKISILSHDKYNDISEWTSPLYSGSGRVNEDKIDGIEVAFEPLDGNQKVSLYYQKKGETEFTLIGETSEKDANTLEFKRTYDNNPLPAFHEVKFKITSVGGKSKVTQLTFYQQHTNDNS